MRSCSWDSWVEQSLSKLESLKLLRSLRPISVDHSVEEEEEKHQIPLLLQQHLETFDGLGPWDRSSVQVQIAETTFQKWLHDVPSTGNGEEIICTNSVDSKQEILASQGRKLLLFSGNDYLGLHSHPAVRKIAAKVAEKLGMGPRGSALICGYTNYHRLLESCLAQLKKKEDCLLCPTGFAANMAVMVTLGSISSLLASARKPLEEEKIAIFSDSLNHASIIDGIRLAERQKEVRVFVYRHCDMAHLNALLSSCSAKKKVVVSDSLFSMDGDFAPIADLAKLRQKYEFLLIIDDAHGTLVCGDNGGGVAEKFNCESDVDICIGTLSKAVGSQGGFIACSKKWKQLFQSRGRSFIFSTALPLPVVAAAHAAIIVAKKERWRRKAVWSRVHDFHALTQFPISSPIISILVGSEDKALCASRYLLERGFHVTAIRPPTVPSNSCRLRVTLCASHSREDVKKLISALSSFMEFPEKAIKNINTIAKL